MDEVIVKTGGGSNDLVKPNDIVESLEKFGDALRKVGEKFDVSKLE